MIIITNLYKRYGSSVVLNNINLRLPRIGLIVIKGPSGCGKTTLLNILGGLIDFKGEIQIDGKHLGLMNEKEKDEYRLKNYGLIFQDFKLLENETVLNNIMFPLETVSSTPFETKYHKCSDLINMVGLKSSIKQRVNKLSGGEKQRVAIARALVNSPKIILADEPTGALDSKNADEVMKILQKISNKSLVVVVSHDDELAYKYADQVIEMEDGIIKSITNQSITKDEKYIPISKQYYSSKKPNVPISFLFRHTLSSIKQKKWRTMICNSVTSLGLIGVGLATSLSTAISSNIKTAYSQIIDENKITISKKNNECFNYGQFAASYYEVMDIYVHNQDKILDVGVVYKNDFESFFPQSDCIYLENTAYRVPIEGLSSRHINDFRWLDVDRPINIYPEEISYLKNDQVVLALTIEMINTICYQLQIERTVNSLARYIQTHELKIYFDFQNIHWQYDDQQLLQVVGFTLEKNPAIYHLNHMWNEYMFEERMRFPTSDEITTPKSTPWILNKIYYIQVKEEMNTFLSYIRSSSTYDPYIFEIANNVYFPSYLKEILAKDVQKVLIFSNTSKNVPVSDYPLFKDINNQICNPIYGSNGGYAIYPSNMMYGFSNMMYFSGHEESIFDVIDTTSSVAVSGSENIKLPDDVLCGHFSQSLTGGVNFKVLNSEPNFGRKPTSINEIVISSKMAETIFKNSALNEPIYLAYLVSQTRNQNGEVIRKYKTLNLTVVGVVNSNKNLIYHDEFWTLNFFQIMLGVSAFNLGVNAIMVDLPNSKEIDRTVSALKRAFPEYDILEPMSDVNKSVNQVCSYVEIALMCFSVVSTIISTLLLSICNYLYILENKKDIGLVRCIGISKREAGKFAITHSLVMCFSSFFLSSIELFITSFIINGEMAKQMGNAFSYIFNPLSLLYMFLLALFVSLSSSIFISFKLNKLDPIAALKQ